MGNLLPNIKSSAIVFEDEVRKPSASEGFNVKNYLNVRLEDGQTEKELIIRLLPMDLETGSPFVKIHTHNVNVPKEMVNPGQKPYKNYICLAKTKDIDHEKFGAKCPFCEMNRAAYTESTTETDPTKKKNLQEISLSYKSKETVICRCIERGKEDEGVKFWKFNIQEKNKQDPYNQIISLCKKREEAARKKGKEENILDIYTGRDLIITIKSNEGTAIPTIMDDSYSSPLSADEEQMKAWIYDSKKWQDVFTCKSYEYLDLVAQMRVPWFDRTTGTWVDKAEWESEHGADTSNIDKEIENASNELKDNADSKQRGNDFISEISLDNKEGDLPF